MLDSLIPKQLFYFLNHFDSILLRHLEIKQHQTDWCQFSAYNLISLNFWVEKLFSFIDCLLPIPAKLGVNVQDSNRSQLCFQNLNINVLVISHNNLTDHYPRTRYWSWLKLIVHLRNLYFLVTRVHLKVSHHYVVFLILLVWFYCLD
jgi:hypothetical protein